MFSRATLGDTSQLTPLKDTKNRLQIQVNRLTHARSHSLQPARTYSQEPIAILHSTSIVINFQTIIITSAAHMPTDKFTFITLVTPL